MYTFEIDTMYKKDFVEYLILTICQIFIFPKIGKRKYIEGLDGLLRGLIKIY